MRRLGFIFLVTLLLAFPSPALADVAPPYNPPGANPEPGSESTQVRMLAETVLIDVKNDGPRGSARIRADFTMRNLGGESESLAVRFPISANNGRGEFPELENLVIEVGGKQITYRRVNYPDVRYPHEGAPWAEFDVTFPAGQNVILQVAYDLSGTGYRPNTAFYYVLHTGAGWKGTIGSADVILRLPYAANTQNVIMDMQIGWALTTPGGEFEENEVRWHFEDFEPGPDSPVTDMEFGLVSPEMWISVLNERANVAANVGDGEAWGRLAKAYKEIFFLSKGYREDAGGMELYRLSVEAYEKCLSIKPDDAQWHAGFADLLIGRSYWDAWMNDPAPDTYRGLNEIHTALRLAPNDPVVLEIAENIRSMLPEGMTISERGYDFPWLTQTPTPLPPPSQTPIVPTALIVLLDPESVSGIYQSDILTLGNGRRLQLTLTLHPDYSAELESKYDNDPPVVSSGTWADHRNGALFINVSAPDQARTVINNIVVNDDRLQITGYLPYYGDPALDFQMSRVVTATPSSTPGSTPAPQSPSPVCGSAALAPLAVILWIRRKRAQENPL
jgi:hypothetical protein